METGTIDYLATGDSSELFRNIAPYFYPTLKAVTSGKRTIPAGFSSINAVSLIDMVRRKLPAGHQFTEDSEEILRQRAFEAAGRVNHVRQVRVKAGQYFDYTPPNEAAQRYARKWATERGWNGMDDNWFGGISGIYHEYAPNKDVLITELVRMCGRFLMTDALWAHHDGLLRGSMYLEFDGSKWNCFCFQHMHAL